jgi:alkylated DNA repair dioxygenase AlkB
MATSPVLHRDAAVPESTEQVTPRTRKNERKTIHQSSDGEEPPLLHSAGSGSSPITPVGLPKGFSYLPGFINEDQEQALLRALESLSFQTFEMHGVMAKRRVVHLGLDYAYAGRSVSRGGAMPGWLLALRDRVAGPMRVDPEEVVEALVTEYAPSAGIGWHLDAPAFGKVAGVSLLSPARFKLRPRPSSKAPSDSRRGTAELIVEPRSLYVMEGSGRWQWQHSIPPGRDLRYSITFRTLRTVNAR